MNKIKFLEFIFNKDDSTISIVLHLWAVILLIISFFIIRWLLKKFLKTRPFIKRYVTPVKIKYGIGGAEIEYNITCNYQNIEIAHRMYIELITRKAAIEIDKDKDVIVEVYNSWYSLFQITRDELKKISGEFLYQNKTSESVINLLTDILNKGLRPHLTEYQAKFRKWYDAEIKMESNQSLSPQEIQKKYPDFEKLMESMLNVNAILIEYSKQLKKITNGA